MLIIQELLIPINQKNLLSSIDVHEYDSCETSHITICINEYTILLISTIPRFVVLYNNNYNKLDAITRRSVSIMCLYLLYWLFQVMVRLQIAMGAEGVRRSSNVARAVRPHMAARHSALQQVSSSAASCFGF